MRVTPTHGGDCIDLAGHVLVMPGSGGFAHLGELCVDALVSSFGLKRVAIVRSHHLLPVVMASAWTEPGPCDAALSLTTAAEIYQGDSAPGMTVLQMRSDIRQGHRGAMAQEILAWAETAKFSEIVVIGSCSSHIKVDADLTAKTDVRFVRTGAPPTAGLPNPSADMLPLGHSLSEEEDAALDRNALAVKQLLRGSGLARPLLLRAAAADTSDGLPGMFCVVGLTSEMLKPQLARQISEIMCTYVASKVGLSAPALKTPPSWQFQGPPSHRQLWG